MGGRMFEAELIGISSLRSNIEIFFRFTKRFKIWRLPLYLIEKGKKKAGRAWFGPSRRDRLKKMNMIKEYGFSRVQSSQDLLAFAVIIGSMIVFGIAGHLILKPPLGKLMLS
jgi:hypothetical protein